MTSEPTATPARAAANAEPQPASRLTAVWLETLVRASSAGIVAVAVLVGMAVNHPTFEGALVALALAVPVAAVFVVFTRSLVPRMRDPFREPFENPREPVWRIALRLGLPTLAGSAFALLLVFEPSHYDTGPIFRGVISGLIGGYALGFAAQAAMVRAAERSVGAPLLYQRTRPSMWRQDFALSRYTVYLAPDGTHESG